MEVKFNVADGETIDRHEMIAYLNTGEYASPVWGAIGRRVTSSNLGYDWSRESSQDILGGVFSTMKTPILSQDFSNWPFSGGDKAQEKIANLAIVEQNARKLANMDMMIAHFWLTTKDNVAASFAERYPSSTVEPTEIGGDGGGSLVSSITVTYGGTRAIGTASKDSEGVMTFTPESEGAV